MRARAFVVGCLTLLLASVVRTPAQQITGVQPKIAGPVTLSSTDPFSGACLQTNAGCVVILPGGYSNLAVQVTGTFSATIAFESCLANCNAAANWNAVLLTPPGTTTGVTSTTTSGMWVGSSPAAFFRSRVTAYTSGSPIVTVYATIGGIPTSAASGGSSAACAGGGGPGTVLFNQGGLCAGDTHFLWDNVAKVMSVGGVAVAQSNQTIRAANIAGTPTNPFPVGLYVAEPDDTTFALGGNNFTFSTNENLGWGLHQLSADGALEFGVASDNFVMHPGTHITNFTTSIAPANLTSALALADASHVLGNYAGTTCGGGQFASAISAAGVATCGTPAGGTPGGSSTDVQCNVAGSLGACDTGLFTASTSGVLITSGVPASVASLTLTTSTGTSVGNSGPFTLSTGPVSQGNSGNISITTGSGSSTLSQSGSIVLQTGNVPTQAGPTGSIAFTVGTMGGTDDSGATGGHIFGTSGDGQATFDSNFNNTAGPGGAITLTSGSGGTAGSTGNGATATAGAGGLVSLIGGAGGASSGNGTNIIKGGGGGAVQLTGGAGGAATGAGTTTGGNGAPIILTPGAGGAGTTPGAPGAIRLQGIEQSEGTKPTISGACGADTQTGGAMAGTFTSRTTGACAVTLTWTRTVPNGFVCAAFDVTTSADYIFQQTGGTSVTATFSSTTVSGDVIRWMCRAY